MTTWKLVQPLDVSSLEFLSLGADAASDLLSSNHYRETSGALTLDIFGSGFRFDHGSLLPFGDIFQIDLFDSLDEAAQVLDMVWSLLKILSYYNPITDRWDLDGLQNYLFHEVDWFDGSEGDDIFGGRGGDDLLNGDGGIDTAVFTGTRGNYTLSRTPDAWHVSDGRGFEGTDTLVDVERLRFNDTSVAIDLDGHAGTVARLIGTVFGKDFLARTDLVGDGLSLLDRGMSNAELSALAVGTDLFGELAGSHSNSDFVRWVYGNVVGSPPSDEALAYYVDLLDDGTTTRAALAQMASETAMAAEQIDLVGLAESGIAFAPVG